MEPGQVVLYALLLAFLILNVRRFFQRRSVPQVDPSSIPSGAVLLDVRTAAERSQGAIPGSIHIPLQELSGRIGELSKFRNSTIVCYCRSGNRSLSAAVRLKKLGFSASNLVGGITTWRLVSRKK
jgi:rhodanese-related sulfurtransferase